MSKENNVIPEAKILRYEDGEKEWKAPNHDGCTEDISNHIEKYIGEINMVFHEMISDTVHIDIHHVKPTTKRPFHTLVTSGMSDIKMNIPENVESACYIELMVTLPEYWKVDEESFKDEKWYWPIRQLKFLARFPHKFDTWLAWGHTIPNGDPAEPFADNTKLSGLIILSSAHVQEEFDCLEINKNKTIEFLSIIPLYNEEMDLKLNKGTDLLLDKFDSHGINDIVVIDRDNVAKKRFGIF